MKKRPEELSELFRRYAQNVSVSIGGSSITAPAFIQPVRYKNKFYLGFEVERLGIRNSSCFLYIGLPEPDLVTYASIARVGYGGREYFIKRADKLYIGDDPVYIWAIIVPVVREGANVNNGSAG